MPTRIDGGSDIGRNPNTYIVENSPVAGGNIQKPNDNCMLSNWGLALGETPIFISSTITSYYNNIFSPPLSIVQTDGLHRDEAAKRLTAATGTPYIFVNTGYKLNTKCLIDAYIGKLLIPNTSTIYFINHFFSEYNERLYIGVDLFLYRLEIMSGGVPDTPTVPGDPAGPESPSGPNLPDPPPGTSLGTGQYLKKIDSGDILETDVNCITYGMWSNNVGNLLSFHTSSLSQQGTGSRLYNLEVRNYASTDCRSKVQFNIAYGHYGGSGSNDLGGYDYMSPSKAIYGQYRSLCLEASQSKFRINGENVDSIYAINVKKSLVGDRMDEGNWELNLHHLSGSQFVATHPRNAYTGSNVTLGVAGRITRIIDDSKINSPTVTSVGEVYNIVSGSIEQGVYNPSSPTKFGLFYPRLGIIILNGNTLDSACNFLTVTGSDVAGNNMVQLYKSISGSAVYTDLSGDYLGFASRKLKKVYSKQYFIRVKNSEFNFSNNPTYYSGSEGLIIGDFVNNSKVYITTVGLYNNRRELVAVAKLSKPICKNFTEEALIKVRIKNE